ncbi:MAG TPA: SigmaK-factor processing regulatory BofA [Firmicutes bacterium]|nr:SigmaK-factor processing regulatory BofA [Bacillota bacterium]
MPVPQWNLIAAVVFTLFVLYVLSRILYQPLKVVLRILLHLLLGGGIIALYNVIGASWNLTVGLNVVSAFLVGVMGLPGLVMLIGLKYILG